FWAKPNTTTQKLIELSASDYVSLASGIVTVAGFGTEVVYVDGRQTTVFPDTNWHHIAIVSSVAITANTVNLGKNGATYYAGLLDDVRIYNYARTANQIKRDYNEGKAMYVGVRAPASCDVDPASCVNKGLVGYWDMDQMGGITATDKSGNGNTGTLTGGPKWAGGVQPFSGGKAGGGALQFDGLNDYVSIGNVGIPANGPATILGWFYWKQLATGSTNKSLYSILYQHTANNKLYIVTSPNGSSYFPGFTPALYTWYYIALTYSGNSSTAKLYVNGVLYNVDTQSYPEDIGALSSFY
ncbi:MAG: hypothetical protein CO102_02540, partial [Candidatus Brennerbacteria bacterium CG_4_9_14_3_um_filter_43_9]